MRVAVTQFATTLNVQDNLASCIRIIKKAGECEPDIIILPEYCNTLPWYVDHNQAWENALSATGDFLQKIAQQAITLHCYIVLNATVQRDLSRDHLNGDIKSNISVTSMVFSPLGELVYQADKQNLTEQEATFFSKGSCAAKVLNTPVGMLGILSGSDDLSFQLPRKLAVSGAQLFCHSMNTISFDQSALHGPTRACENRVFLASSNKVGLSIAKEQLATYADKKQILEKHLVGVGQSQIVSPNGNVLAKIAHNDEGFTFADIDLTQAGISSKNYLRPDGTALTEQLRPELYQQLTPLTLAAEDLNKLPTTVNVALFTTYKTNDRAIEDVCFYIENNLSDIIQLPELFFVADKTILTNEQQRAEIATLSEQFITQVSAQLRPFQYVCTSLIIGGEHQAVIINEHGILAKQQQLHFCQRYQRTPLGNELTVIKLPLEQGSIRLAMLTADDANIPEMVNVAALNNIQVLLVPFDIQEACEVEYSLLSRAAEHRICIVAATREKSFSQSSDKSHKSTGFIANLASQSALLAQWQSRKFAGYSNHPLVKYQHGKITKALIHPITACSKKVGLHHS